MTNNFYKSYSNASNIDSLDASVYESVFHDNLLPMAITNDTGNFLYVNNAFCDYLGYSKKEIYNLTLMDVTVQDELGKISNVQWNELKNGHRESITVEKRYRKRNGELAHSVTVVCPVYQNKKLMKGMTIGTLYDMADNTERGKELYRLAIAPEDSVLARLVGDEFALLLPDTDEKDALYLSYLIIEEITRSITINHYNFTVGASAGIAAYPFHGTESEEILRNSDIAMSRAKELKNGVKIFTHEMAETFSRKVKIKKLLTKAIDEGQLHVNYQPIIELDSGDIKKVEALVRWKDEGFGDVQASEIISYAEEMGMIGKLGRCVLDQVLQQLLAWREAGLDIFAAVNISANELYSNDFVENIRLALEKYELPASALGIEITETAGITEGSGQQEVVNSLKEMGLAIAVDDFGKGYSSISYLQSASIDNIKIDMKYVHAIQCEDDTFDNPGRMIHAIVDLAKRFGHKVVAEGVETKLQYDFLKTVGCDYIQGYYIAEPLAADKVQPFLQKAA